MASQNEFTAKYDVGTVLGQGSFATVYNCTSKESGESFAVKVVDKSKAGPKDIADATHEIEIMARIGYHKNVVRMIEYFSTRNHLYIVMDLLDGGMLFDRIVKLQHYSEKSAAEAVRRMLEALAHIHSTGVIHRDLKPENLLLPHPPADDHAEVTDVCIADFGLAAVGPSSICCGSPSYIAPEVIKRGYYKMISDPYTEKCDIWSVGVITYVLLCGRLPFFGTQLTQVFQKIVQGNWSYKGPAWKHVSETAKSFLELCLRSEPEKRLGASELLNHPWLQPGASKDIHLEDVQSSLATLCEKRSRAAGKVFVLAKIWLSISPDDRPPFMKYLIQDDVLSTRLRHSSQTNPSVKHELDYSMPLRRGNQKGFKLQDCCSCSATMVCRHIQNLHEYLFVGKASQEVLPFMDVIIATTNELYERLTAEGETVELLEQLLKGTFALEAACVFSIHLAAVPIEELKPNFMVSPARPSSKVEKVRLWAHKKHSQLNDRLRAAKEKESNEGRTSGSNHTKGADLEEKRTPKGSKKDKNKRNDSCFIM